jgi:hypothetical protein
MTLPFAGRQTGNSCFYRIDRSICGALTGIERHGFLDAGGQFVVVERLFKKIERPFFQGRYGQGNVAVAGQEYDRQGRLAFA